MYNVIDKIECNLKELEVIKLVLEKMKNDFKLENDYFNVIIIDDIEIKEINKEFRGKDSSTDVISFALQDTVDINMPVKMLGDIYISIDKAKEQSISYKHSLRREIAFLTVHGMLHLLGYDHMNKEDEEEMFKLQDEILEELKIERSV